jgi:SAM-dependent methyltransferase
VSGVRPVRRATGAVLRAAPQLAPRLEKLLWRTVYEAASLRPGDGWSPLMNYGYAPLESAAGEEAAPAPVPAGGFGLGLYARVAGAIDLHGLDVLEVGCGRGGGTAFVFEQFGPRSLTGLDLARRAIERCRRRYARPGLSFVAGDAEALPFGAGSFDVVLSVESSHCYADIPRFLSEVRRVLRPGGRFLIADPRHTERSADTEQALFHADHVALWREQLAAAGFATLEEEDITANVMRALQLDTPARRERIEQHVPALLRPYVFAFSAAEGSAMYQAYAEGKMTYLRFVLQRD